MKLFELTGVKHLKDSTIDDIGNLLDAKNVKKIGHGCFSVVFKHNDRNEVIKFWVKDKAYDKFINFVKDHQDSPIWPKLHSTPKKISTFFKKTADDFPDKINYVRMESLTPINKEDIHCTTCKKVCQEIKNCIKDHMTEPFEIFHMTYIGVFDRDEDNLRHAFKGFTEKDLEVLVEGLTPFMKVFSVDDLDFHPDNFMKRKNGQLVVIDPVADEDDVEIARLIRNQLHHSGSNKFVKPIEDNKVGKAP